MTGEVPRYWRIAAVLADHINAGTLEPGEPLGVTAVARRVRCSINTAAHALDVLIADGLVEPAPVGSRHPTVTVTHTDRKLRPYARGYRVTRGRRRL